MSGSVSSRVSGGGLSASSSFTPSQLTFFHAVDELVAAAVGAATTSRIDLAPLQQLTELAVHQRAGRSHADTVAVLQHVLPDLAAQLQSLHSAKAKTWLLDFLEQIVKMDASPFMPQVITIVTSMTAEDNIAVVKKVLSLSCSLFPLVYSWLSSHSHAWGGVHEHMYRTAVQLREQLIGLWNGPSEAIKPAVIKFMEIAILTLTNDRVNPPMARSSSAGPDRKDELRPFSLRELAADHPVLTQAALKEDVTTMLTTLLSFTPGTATTFTALLKTLSTLCKQRSLLLSDRIVERLNEIGDLLLMEEQERQILPSEQQVSRVKKDVQAAMLEVLKTQSFNLPTFDAQQTALLRSLTALGAEGQAQDVIRAHSAKRAEHQKQQGATYLKEITKVDAQQLAPAQTQPRPTPLPIASLMHQLDELSRLPSEVIVELVSSHIDAFVVPPSCAESYSAAEPSPVFLDFLQECLTASFHTERADTPVAQRQQFQHVAEIIRAHSQDAIHTLFPAPAPSSSFHTAAAASQMASPPVPSVSLIARTTVPPVPILDLRADQLESMSRSAFTRIASTRTASSVQKSGETILRNVILAKLSTTNLLHPRAYTQTIDPTLESTHPQAVVWSSSLLQGQTVLPLRAYISGRLQDSAAGGYESVLNVLYSLLCLDTTTPTILTQVKEREAEEGAMATLMEDEPEEGEYAQATAEDASMQEEEKKESASPSEEKDADMKDDTAAGVAVRATGKRKRTAEEAADSMATATEAAAAAAGTPADDAQPDSKRLKGDVASPSSSSSVLPLVAAVLPDFAHHGTIEYGEALDLLLGELREGSSAESQQLYRRFLLDLPLLTPRVFASMDDWIYDPARSVIGLSALRDLILYRPPVRDTSLDLLLGYTHKPQLPQLRNQAIRLVVNQLYTPAANAHLRPAIVAYAHKLVDQLANPDQLLEDLPEIVVNVVVPPVPIYDLIELPPMPAKKGEPKTPSTPATGTATPGAVDAPTVVVKVEGASSSGGVPPPSPAMERQSSTEADRRARAEAADLKTRQEIAQKIADADRRKKTFDKLVFLRSLREKEKKLMEQQREERQKRRVDRVTRHLELFLSLCVHDPPMLRRLLRVYAACPSAFVHQCIHEQMPRIVRVLARLAMEPLVKVLEEETLREGAESAACEPLVLHCLQLLTATSAPSASLIQSVTRMYHAKQSPRYLVPILAGLPLEAIRRYLPKLIHLPVEELRQAFQKLLHAKPPSSIKPAELLIALHLIPVEPRKRPATQQQQQPAGQQQQPSAIPSSAVVDPAQLAKERKEDEDALDKRVIVATKLCFDDPASFPAEVLGVVLSQLSDHAPLPKLLMRTVMQSLLLHASLKGFIVSTLLMKLINKHIYLSPVLWQGYLTAGTMLLPQSIPVLCQLPDNAFIQMMAHPKFAKLQDQLVQFIQSRPLQVRRSIREIVQQIVSEKNIAAQAKLGLYQQQAQQQA